VVKGYYTIVMASAMRENSRIICGTAMVFLNSTKSRSIEESGRLMSYQDKEN
jgi:hypothetical protein